MMFIPFCSKRGTERKRPLAMSSRISLADGDLVAFVLEGQRERDADRVADAAGDELLEGDARLDDAVRRHARPPVTPRCSGTSGRAAAKRMFASMTLFGSESFSETTY